MGVTVAGLEALCLQALLEVGDVEVDRVGICGGEPLGCLLGGLERKVPGTESVDVVARVIFNRTAREECAGPESLGGG